MSAIYTAVCHVEVDPRVDSQKSLPNRTKRMQALEDEGWVTSGYTGTQVSGGGRQMGVLLEHFTSWVVTEAHRVLAEHREEAQLRGRGDFRAEPWRIRLIPHGTEHCSGNSMSTAQAKVKSGLVFLSQPGPAEWGGNSQERAGTREWASEGTKWLYMNHSTELALVITG